MTKPATIRDLRSVARVIITQGTILTHRSTPDEIETWHNIGEGGQPSFENGWQNLNTSVSPCGYRKDASGFVHLRGVVEGIPASGTGGYSTIFTLPASWRPASTEARVCRFAENQVGELDSIYIRSNGQVVLRWPVAGNAIRTLFLDNYQWKAVTP